MLCKWVATWHKHAQWKQNLKKRLRICLFFFVLTIMKLKHKKSLCPCSPFGSNPFKNARVVWEDDPIWGLRDNPSPQRSVAGGCGTVSPGRRFPWRSWQDMCRVQYHLINTIYSYGWKHIKAMNISYSLWINFDYTSSCMFGKAAGEALRSQALERRVHRLIEAGQQGGVRSLSPGKVGLKHLSMAKPKG